MEIRGFGPSDDAGKRAHHPAALSNDKKNMSRLS
jgi:hypothetical protein